MRIAQNLLPALFLPAACFLLVSSPGLSQNSPKPDASVAKSIFDDKLHAGKDPFFPNSARRQDRPASTDPKMPQAPVVQLFLKAITGPPTRRLALINNQTFAAGEEGLVKVVNGQVKIRCVEIKDGSVVVAIEGNPEPKELKLREGL